MATTPTPREAAAVDENTIIPPVVDEVLTDTPVVEPAPEVVEPVVEATADVVGPTTTVEATPVVEPAPNAVTFDGLSDKQNRDFNTFINALPDDAREVAISDTQLPKNLTAYNDEASGSAYKKLIQNTWGALQTFDQKNAADNGITDKPPLPNRDSFRRSMHEQTQVDVRNSIIDSMSTNDLANEIGFTEPSELSERIDSYNTRINKSLANKSDSVIAPRRRVSLINRMLAEDFNGAVNEHRQTLGDMTPEQNADLDKQAILALRETSEASYDGLANTNASAAAKPVGFIDFLSKEDNPFHPSITDSQKNVLLRSMSNFDQGLKQDVGFALLSEKDRPEFSYQQTVDKIQSVTLLDDRRAKYHPSLTTKDATRNSEIFPAVLAQYEALQQAADNPVVDNDTTLDNQAPIVQNPTATVDVNDLLSEANQDERDNRMDNFIGSNPVGGPLDSEVPVTDSSNIKFNNLPPDDAALDDSGIVLPAAEQPREGGLTSTESDVISDTNETVAPKPKAKAKANDTPADTLPAGVVRAIPIAITTPNTPNADRSEFDILMKAVSDNEYLSGKFDIGELDELLHEVDKKLLKSDNPPTATVHAAILHEEMSNFMKDLTKTIKDEPNADGTKKNYLETRQVDVDISKAVDSITEQHYKESKLMDYPNVAETQYPSPLTQEQVDAVRHAVSDLPNGVKHHVLSELKDNLVDNADFKFDDVVDSIKNSLHDYDSSYKTVRPEAESKLSAFSDTLQSKVTESNKTAENQTVIKPFTPADPSAPKPESTTGNTNTGGDTTNTNTVGGGDGAVEELEEEDPELTDEEKRERELQRQQGLGGGGGGRSNGGGGGGGGGTSFSLFANNSSDVTHRHGDLAKKIKEPKEKKPSIIKRLVSRIFKKKEEAAAAINANTATTESTLVEGNDNAVDEITTATVEGDNEIKRNSKLSADGTVEKAEHVAKVDAMINDLNTTPDNSEKPNQSQTSENTDNAPTPPPAPVIQGDDSHRRPSVTDNPPQTPSDYTSLQNDDFAAVTAGMDKLMADFQKEPKLGNKQLTEKTNELLSTVSMASLDVSLAAHEARRSGTSDDDYAKSLEDVTNYLDGIKNETKTMAEERGLLEGSKDNDDTNYDPKDKTTPKSLAKQLESVEETIESSKKATAGLFSSFKMGNVMAAVGGLFRSKGK